MQLNSKQFSVEEFKDQATWIGKLFTGLNQFLGEVNQGFKNGMTVNDNLYQEIREVKWVNKAQNFPLKFITKFAVHPRGLMPIYLLNNTTGNYSSLQPWIAWGYSDGQVTISEITGLNPNETYTIRILVIYG